jgi:hypothetical protein
VIEFAPVPLQDNFGNEASKPALLLLRAKESVVSLFEAFKVTPTLAVQVD